MTKTNRIAFYVGEVFVVTFFLTILMILPFLFKKSYSTPIERDFPELPFTTNYARDTGTTANYINEAFSHCTGDGCNILITDAGSAVDNFKVPVSYSTSYSDNTDKLIKSTYLLQKNYLPIATNDVVAQADGNPTFINNDGFRYISNHGYYSADRPGPIFIKGEYGEVPDNSIKQYITQIATWLYIYERVPGLCVAASGNNTVSSCSFNYVKTVGEETTYTSISAADVRKIIANAANIEGYKYLNYIIKLVDEAEKAEYADEYTFDPLSNPSYNFEGNNLVSSLITPTTKDESYIDYYLKINDPNKYGVYLVDSSGAKITNLENRTGGFKIVIPVSNYGEGMDLTSVKVVVTGRFLSLTPYAYHATNFSNETTTLLNSGNKLSNIFLSVYDIGMPIIETWPYNYVILSKVDITNGKELAGAKLSVTNTSTGSKIEWTSTNKPYKTYLEKGEYKFCETVAPKGYAKQNNCVNFTVDGKKVERIKLESAPVPDTAAGVYKGIYYIGSLLLLVGIGVITTLLFKEKHKVKTTE